MFYVLSFELYHGTLKTCLQFEWVIKLHFNVDM